MSQNNDLVFNTYLVSIAGIVDACWYIILTLAVTTASALSFFQKKNKFYSKNTRFSLHSSWIRITDKSMDISNLIDNLPVF